MAAKAKCDAVADDRIRRTDARRRSAAVPRQRSARPADSARALRGSRASLRSARRTLAVQRSHDAAGGGLCARSCEKKGVQFRSRSGCATGNRTRSSAMRELADGSARRVLGFIMAAHRSEASFERYQATVDDARANCRRGGAEVVYPARGTTIRCSSRRWRRAREALARFDPAERSRAADLHRAQYSARDGECGAVRRAAYAVGADCRGGCLGIDTWQFAYQSRSGSPRDAWLEPDIKRRLRGSRREAAVVVPIGFLCDHVEVLYDLDIEAAQVARDAGIRMERAPTVGDHPLFIEMMASIVAAHARCSTDSREGLQTRHSDPQIKRVAVIGGGITGLAPRIDCANWLRRASFRSRCNCSSAARDAAERSRRFGATDL